VAGQHQRPQFERGTLQPNDPSELRQVKLAVDYRGPMLL